MSSVELLIEKFILSSMVLNIISVTYQVSKFVSFCSLSILFHWLVFLVTVILQYLVHYFFYLILFQVDPANLSYLCFCIKFKISLPIYTKNKPKKPAGSFTGIALDLLIHLAYLPIYFLLNYNIHTEKYRNYK